MNRETKVLASVVKRMTERRDYLLAHHNKLTIDGDVHPSDIDALPEDVLARIQTDPNYYQGRPLLSDGLLARLEMAGIDMAACWQNPAVLPYGDDEAQNAKKLRGANERIAKLADRHPTRVIPAGWTDPKALGVDRAVELAQYCVEELAMPVVKMNPAQNAYPIDSDMVFQVVDAIVATGAVPAFHFGADTQYTPTEGLVRVAKRHPDHPVIAVHMGGGGAHFVEAEETYQTARAAGLENPNIFYPLSAKRDAHIESDLITYAKAGAPFCNNIAIATDAPYCDPVWTMGGFRSLIKALADGDSYPDPRIQAKPDLFDADMIQGIMGSNYAKLIIAAYDRILSIGAR